MPGFSLRTKLFSMMAVILFAVSSCHHESSEYDDVPNYGQRNVTITSATFDTLRLDASHTSLSGQWHMKDSLLCFVDEYVVGVKEYDLAGDYVGEHIRQGNGPNEILAPSFSSTFDNLTGDLVMEDTNCFLHRFSSDYSKTYSLEKAWFTALDSGFDSKEWENLKEHPSPEIPEMYEYNFECDRIQSVDSKVVIPVITEHVRYNGYEKKYNKGFWSDSYIFISFSLDDLAGSRRLFGHYPPLYAERNIPIFAKYDSYAGSDGVTVGFAADYRIFMMDWSGRVTGCFGFPEEGISGRYPQTSTFDEYESSFNGQRKKFGFYDRLAKCGDYVFRTCHLDNNAGSRLQIYNSVFDLVGVLEVSPVFEIIGESQGCYYAYQGLDLDSEEFLIVRFRI